MSDIASFKIPPNLAELSANSRVIYNPTSGNKKLPDLDSLSAGLSANSQLHFIFDKKSAANETSRINYSDLSACNIEAMRIAPLVRVEHEWTLSNKTNAPMLLNTQAIFNADKQYKDGEGFLSAGYAAINYEYYKTGVLGKIIDLSNLLYHRPKVPSFRGQIIYSNKLATEEAVKSIYGGESWQQLNFCFMCGQTATGNTEENSITKFGELSVGEFSTREYFALNDQETQGGEEYVKLAAKHISPHTHRLKAESESFTLSWEITPNVDYFWTATGNPKIKSNLGSGQNNKNEAKLESAAKVSAKFSGELTISTKSLWGNIAMASDIYDSSGKGRKISNPKHNNMPPFETVYVWKRIL